MRQILVDYMPLEYSPELLSEASTQSNGVLRIHGVLQRANIKNQNGRIYPKKLLMRESVKYAEMIREHRAIGELDHPDSPVVNLRNVSHNIVAIKFEGDDMIGTIEILSTPAGNIVKELMRNGIRLGVSSRGMGSVREIDENTVEVQDDFQLICFDLVSNPSTQGAFLTENNAQVPDAYANLNNLMYEFFAELK